MKQTVAAVGSIATILIPTFFYFKHSALAVICVCIGISCAIVFGWLSIRDRNLEKKLQRPKNNKPMGVGTDENSRLIIKAISDETNGFMTLSDIVRDTNLPLKRINKTLDWLLMNNFAIQRKARNGKVFILTPEGRSVFSQLINENLNKP